MTRSFANVKLRFEGVHHYPNAPHEVSFLRHPHRHLFYVEVSVEQFHDERDVEYIILKRWLRGEVIAPNLSRWNSDENTDSCETMARHILRKLIERFPNRDISVKVSEDEENGATLVFEKD